MGKKRLRVVDVTYQKQGLDKIGPILPSFQHAKCEPAALQENTKGCNLSVEWTSPSEVALDLELQTETMKYRSVKSQGEPRAKYFRTFLAIRDKNTGNTRLIEANETVLAPVIQYPKSNNPVLLQESTTTKSVEERMEASKHLIKSFGQSKGARYYEQQDKMQVDGSQLEDKVLKAAGGVSADQVADVPLPPEISVIPKRQNEARRSDQIYLVEDLLTAAELQRLVESGETVLQDWKSDQDLAEAQKAKELSPLGADIFRKFIFSSGDLGNRVGLALYMQGIISFSKLRPGQLSLGEKCLPKYLPLTVKKKILSTFSMTSGGRSRVVTPEMKDRAICHVMVLALLINSFKLDSSLLSESIRVRPDHLKKLVSTVGAHLVSDSDTNTQFIVLKLPLASFNMNYVGKKKNRK